MKLAIYLAGSIQKDHEKNDTFWSSEHMDRLRSLLNPIELSFLNPAFRTDDLSDSYSIFGRDMLQVFSSDLIFVDARDRRGLGVGAEMMWAKLNSLPVLTWSPENTHYNKKKATLLGVAVEHYVHPFVASLSDKIVSTLEEAAEWLKGFPYKEVKGREHIEKAMEYYKLTQLQHDTPMLELLRNNEGLKDRFIVADFANL